MAIPARDYLACFEDRKKRWQLHLIYREGITLNGHPI